MQPFLYAYGMKMYVRHGLTKTPTYDSWYNAIRRCEDPTNQDYSNYGGRGIFMCDGMRRDLRYMVMAIGIKPEGMTLDRIDNNDGYTCGYCDWCKMGGHAKNIHWATSTEQIKNRRSYKSNTNGYPGVTQMRSGRYQARVYINGKRTSLGSFETAEEAYNERKGYTNA